MTAPLPAPRLLRLNWGFTLSPCIRSPKKNVARVLMDFIEFALLQNEKVTPVVTA